METPIVKFLLARIDEDEAIARAAEPRELVPETRLGWREHAEEVRLAGVLADGSTFLMTAPGAEPLLMHIARHDPARVLAECAAKRLLIEQSTAATGLADGLGAYCDDGTNCTALALEGALLILAQPYYGHPDFDPAWRP